MIIYGPDATSLCIGRFLAGLSAGGSMTLAPLYVSEISQDHIRGSLGSFFILATNFGMLLVYTAGDFFNYYTTPKIMLLLPLTFFVLFAFFPETPSYLLRHNKIKEAESSLKFLRCCKQSDEMPEDVRYELQQMIRKADESMLNNRGSLISELGKIYNCKILFALDFEFVLTGSPAAKKGIFIGLVLMTTNQLSGLFAFLNYTADIFIDAGSTFNPNTSAIIVGALLFLGSLISLSIIDRFSRKFLYTVTTVGNLIGLMAMGMHSYIKVSGDDPVYKLVPVLSLSLVIFSAAIGRLPLTYIMMSEMMPHNIRSFGISICITFNWILCFILLRYFSTAVELFQFHTCMFIFGVSTLVGMIFVMFYVPESKNRSYEEIETALMGKKFEYIQAEQSEKKQVETENA